jgi:hypothetical protein
MEIAETRREKKERLHLTYRRLMSLKLRVDDCLSKNKPMSATDYNALQTLAQSNDHVIQIAVLDEALEQTEEEMLDVWAELARERYHDFYEYMNRDEGPTEDAHGNPIAPPGFKLSRTRPDRRPAHGLPQQGDHAVHAVDAARPLQVHALVAPLPGVVVRQEPEEEVPPSRPQPRLRGQADRLEGQGDRRERRLPPVFPDIRIRSDMKAASAWGLTNLKGEYVAKGVGQGISGFRGNYGMVDDPFKSREAAESQTTRDSVFTWYSDDFTTRLLPGSPLGIIMTRWHSDDICGRITERRNARGPRSFKKSWKNFSKKNRGKSAR